MRDIGWDILVELPQKPEIFLLFMYLCCKPPFFTTLLPPASLPEYIWSIVLAKHKGWQAFPVAEKEVFSKFSDKKGTCSATNLPRHCQSHQKTTGMFRFMSDHVNLKESLKSRKGYSVAYGISFLVIPSFTLCILTFSSYPKRKLMWFQRNIEALVSHCSVAELHWGFSYNIYVAEVS